MTPDTVSMAQSLPSELWLTIFRWAASEPYEAFDTSPLPIMSPEGRAWTHRETLNNLYDRVRKDTPAHEYRTRVRTRTALVLVCKHWYDLAIGILYEFVVLKKRYSCLTFARTLSGDDTLSIGTWTSAFLAPENGLHLGRFIQRLSIHISNEIWRNLMPFAEYFATSLRNCHNISILSVSVDASPNCEKVDDLVTDAILQSNPIRYIKRKNHFLPVLKDTLRLDTIQVLTIPLYHPSTSFPTLSFPQLHTLELYAGPIYDSMIENAFRGIAQWHMPVIRRVYIPSSYDNRPKHYLTNFFKALGSTLTSLDFGTTEDSSLPLILPYCVSIREMTFSSRVTHDIAPVLPRLCGVNVHVRGPRRSEVVAAMDSMAQSMKFLFDNRGSSLTCIRILEPSLNDFAILSGARWTGIFKGIWEHWISQWEVTGVRFEFQNGELIRLPEETFEQTYYTFDVDG
jgi:hypothetical protein